MSGFSIDPVERLEGFGLNDDSINKVFPSKYDLRNFPLGKEIKL